MQSETISSREFYGIIEEYPLPVAWGTFEITLEFKGIYACTGRMPGFGVGGYTSEFDDYELDRVEIWSPDGTEIVFDKMPDDLKASIREELDKARM